MIPRTAKMAKEVAARLTTPQELDFGNVILNGYATTGANTTGKMSWAWPDSPLLPAVPLPSVTSVRPALKGWTTNYQEYFTQLQPNGYGVDPGDPTMFEYTVHSFTPQRGAVATLGAPQAGQGYIPGFYTNVPTASGTPGGSGATLDINVDADGKVTTATINSPGSGYAVGDGLGLAAAPPPLGGGSGFAVEITSITPIAAGSITSLISLVGGSGYTPGTYTNVPLTGGTGAGATATIVVTASGPPVGPVAVSGATLIQDGIGYHYSLGANYQLLTVAVTGTGSGFAPNSTTVAGALPGTVDITSINFVCFGGVCPLYGIGYSPGDIVEIPDPLKPPLDPPPSQKARIRIDSVVGTATGPVTTVTLVNGGNGYLAGDVLSATLPGGGGFSITVGPIPPVGDPAVAYAQTPRRFFQNQVGDFLPPTANQRAIPYSFIYPVADSTTPPPIDTL